jgi:hypothetical protein
MKKNYYIRNINIKIMIDEITIINSSLNEIESNFGVIFNRNNAVVESGTDQFGNTYKFIHLIVDVWVQPEISTNKHIISCLSIIKPDNTSGGSFPNVLIRESGTYNNGEIIDKTGAVLGSFPTKLNQPKAIDPKPEFMFIEPSIHISSVHKEDDGSITVTGSFDITINFISWDIYEFSQNFNLPF